MQDYYYALYSVKLWLLKCIHTYIHAIYWEYWERMNANEACLVAHMELLKFSFQSFRWFHQYCSCLKSTQQQQRFSHMAWQTNILCRHQAEKLLVSATAWFLGAKIDIYPCSQTCIQACIALLHGPNALKIVVWWLLWLWRLRWLWPTFPANPVLKNPIL